MLLFNTQPVLSYQEIMLKTQLDDESMKSSMFSLVKHGVLHKKPLGTTITRDDSYKVNDIFSPNQSSVRLDTIRTKQKEEDHTAAAKTRLANSRPLAMDACLVRIMKHRQRLSSSILVAEAMKQVIFSVTEKDLEVRIKGLIERHYLRRDVDDKTIYVYIP